MLRRVTVAFMVLAVLGCIASAVMQNAHIYFLCFEMFVAAVLLGLLVLAMNLIWKLLPGHLKKTNKGKRGRFNAVFFFSFLFCYIVAGAIDLICFSDAAAFIRLLSNTATFAFAVFLGWSLIRHNKGKTIVAGSVIFILFIVSLWFGSSISLRSGEIMEVSSIEKLKSLGYAKWVPSEKSIEKMGVTQYDPELAFDGISLYCSKTLHEAYLLDMKGEVIHKWSEKHFPPELRVELQAKRKKTMGLRGEWRHVEMCKNGDLMVVIMETALIRLGWDSRIKREKKLRVHHDVCFDENAKIYTLAREPRIVFWHGIPVLTISDSIVVFSPSMEIMKKVYIYEVVKEQVPLHMISKIYRVLLGVFEPKNMLRIFKYKAKITQAADMLHANAIEIMNRDIEGFCKKGDWLICLRHLDLVGVIDPEKQELVWSWGPGELDWPHHPTLLKNGNVLIFDNGRHKGFSRIIELNPLTRKIVWEYKSTPPEKFFSSAGGSNQRLPNGNTLITESNRGYVFEITKEGRVVWDFYSTNVKVEDKKRETIYRMTRIVNP